jgi:protein-disulfide isomerase
MTEATPTNRLTLFTGIAALALLVAGGGYFYGKGSIGARTSDDNAAATAADSAAAKAGLSSDQRKATEAIVRAYILENPEILTEAAAILQRRETIKRLAEAGDALTKPFAGAVGGNPNGDVTLVEFTDYSCGFCRSSVADVKRLVGNDGNIRLVYREVPILSPASKEAAKWALAAAKQGKHQAFHDAMFSGDKPNDASIRAAAQRAGLNMTQASKDAASTAVEAEIEANLAMMRSVGFGGTPTFIIGDQILEGALGHDALKAAVDKARKKT